MQHLSSWLLPVGVANWKGQARLDVLCSYLSEAMDQEVAAHHCDLADRDHRPLLALCLGSWTRLMPLDDPSATTDEERVRSLLLGYFVERGIFQMPREVVDCWSQPLPAW